MSASSESAAVSGAKSPKLEGQGPDQLPILALGLSLSSFLALSYLISVVAALMLPEPTVQAWLQLFPGAPAFNWWGVIKGLAVSIICGWYIAYVFGTIYNFFSARFR